MEWIKRRTFDYALRRARKKKKEHRHKGRLRAGSFLILYTSDSTEIPKALDHFIRSLNKSGKKVRFVHYVPSIKEGRSGDLVLRLSKRDSSWYGAPSSEALQKIIDTSWDVLISLDESIPRIHRYTIALCHARFKVGLAPEVAEEFDLLVDLTDDLSTGERIEEVKSVLRTVSVVLD